MSKSLSLILGMFLCFNQSYALDCGSVKRPMTREEFLANKGDAHCRDLTGVDLSGLTVLYPDFRWAILRNANLDNFSCTGSRPCANFFAADLTGATARHANLGDFEAAIVDGVDFTGSSFSHVTGFRGASARGAVFDETLTYDLHFSGADLTGASFKRAELNRAYFGTERDGRENWPAAKLSGTDFSESKLFCFTNFHDADYSKVIFTGSKYSKFLKPSTLYSQAASLGMVYVDRDEPASCP